MLDGNKYKGENHRAEMLPEVETLETFKREPSKALTNKATLE